MRRPFAVLAASLLALTPTCKNDAPPVPTTVTVTPGTVTLSAIGSTQALAATVRDQNGRVMNGQGITWTSNAGGVATVSPSGVVTAVGNGSATVTAAAGSVTGTASVTVAQTVSALAKAGGDGQSAAVGTALSTALVVRANDANGHGVAGVTVTLAVTQGGGNLSAASQVTGANGQTAGVTWTIGTTAGAAQQVAASAAGASGVTFTATATAGPPTSVALQAGDGQTGPTGLALPTDPAVIVHDAFNNPVPNAVVTFAVTAGGGSVTGAVDTTGGNGIATVGSWVMGDPDSTQTLTATVTGAGITGNPVTFTATATPIGAPETVTAFDGDNQTGLAGFAVNVAPAAIVRDAASAPVPNVQVDFAVATGGGSVTGATAITGVDGVARVGSWVLGAVAGPNTMTATVASLTPAVISATGATRQFNIEIRFQTTVTTAQQEAFDSAEARWERLLYGELSDVQVNPGSAPPTCGGVTTPNLNEVIDDLVILVRLDSIDGPLNILGSAGPCLIRNSNSLPLLGGMRFDTADVATFLNSGLFDEIVMHEMGHVLGLGSVWELKGLLVGPSRTGGTDPHFVGPLAIAAFDASGGAGYVAGAKVPVENTGGPGTVDGHWRESVFETELMTGFLNLSANPLSVISVASMADLAYPNANNAAADAYTVANPLALRVAPAARVPFGDDVHRGPIHMVDPSGRVVRVVRP
jgi:hypothetical protein